MGHITTSFETNFKDEIRTNGFDFNVVLSQWVDDNPNHPLDYNLLTWLATFFGWDSACNLSSFLVDPNDTARLEEFLLNNTASSTGPGDLSTATPTGVVPGLRDPAPPVEPSTEPVSHLRRRPAAAIPSNFSSDSKFHTPPASTTADDDMEVEEGTSRASVAQALVTEYDDSDEEDDDAGANTDDEDNEDEPVEIAPSAPAPKTRK
ncbi:hypothetical protein F5880DRAFT_1619550 [Lentinula raphanica]|nr:hypothetical protein F5880DRAFT_1619550 [Lentinula raphanica]